MQRTGCRARTALQQTRVSRVALAAQYVKSTHCGNELYRRNMMKHGLNVFLPVAAIGIRELLAGRMASVTYDAIAGPGFIGKADVQYTFG